MTYKHSQPTGGDVYDAAADGWSEVDVLLGLAEVNKCRKWMKMKVVKWCWKSEMDIFWCISMSSNEKSCKKSMKRLKRPTSVIFFRNICQVSSWGNPDLMEYLSQTMLNHAKKINEKAQKANLRLEFRLGGSQIWWNIKCQTSSSQFESFSLITCTNLIFRPIKIKFPPNYVCCHIFLALIQSILTASKFVEKSWWAWSRRAHFSLA